MDKIAKALNRLSSKERERLKLILEKIACGDVRGLDIKKLKDRNDIYRVRSGDLRIIFRKNDDGKFFVLTIARRDKSTYNFD